MSRGTSGIMKVRREMRRLKVRLHPGRREEPAIEGQALLDEVRRAAFLAAAYAWLTR